MTNRMLQALKIWPYLINSNRLSMALALGVEKAKL